MTRLQHIVSNDTLHEESVRLYAKATGKLDCEQHRKTEFSRSVQLSVETAKDTTSNRTEYMVSFLVLELIFFQSSQ